MWKYEELSEQNDDKSIESVEVEVHIVVDVRMLLAHALRNAEEKVLHDEWTFVFATKEVKSYATIFHFFSVSELLLSGDDMEIWRFYIE